VVGLARVVRCVIRVGKGSGCDASLFVAIAYSFALYALSIYPTESRLVAVPTDSGNIIINSEVDNRSPASLNSSTLDDSAKGHSLNL
jgi:hypothetical protein